MFGGDEDDSASAAGGRVVADDEDGGDGGSSTMGDTETPRVVGFVLHPEQEGGQGDTEPDLLQQARKLQAAVVVDMHNAALENTAALSLCTSAQVSGVGEGRGSVNSLITPCLLAPDLLSAQQPHFKFDRHSLVHQAAKACEFQAQRAPCATSIPLTLLHLPPRHPGPCLQPHH